MLGRGTATCLGGIVVERERKSAGAGCSSNMAFTGEGVARVKAVGRGIRSVHDKSDVLNWKVTLSDRSVRARFTTAAPSSSTI